MVGLDDCGTRAETTPTMSLDFDTLLEIMSRVDDRPTLSRFMRTCRTLYFKGTPLLLRLGVSMNDVHLSSFCDFMLSDTSRLQFLCEAGFGLFYLGWSGSELARSFATVLQGASNLRKLSLHFSVLRRHPRVIRAISTLERIQELTLDGLPEEEQHIFQNIKSPIRKITVSFHGRERYISRPNFVQVLAPLRNFLEDITVKFASWPESDSGIRYPKVTSLTLVDCVTVDTVGLVFAFPNLCDLQLRFEHEWGDEWRALPEPTRLRNLARQEHASWSSLRTLDCSLTHLYILAPSCSINHLIIDVCLPSDTCLPWYLETLQLAQPTRLNLLVRRPVDLLVRLPDIQNMITLLERTPMCLCELVLSIHYNKSIAPLVADFIVRRYAYLSDAAQLDSLRPNSGQVSIYNAAIFFAHIPVRSLYVQSVLQHEIAPHETRARSWKRKTEKKL